MLIVKIKKGNLNKALKEFKRKFKQTGVLNELKERKYFKKKSLEKRLLKNKAIRKLKKEKENNDE